MKNLIVLMTCIMATLSVFAQSPQNINYQAVVRNNTGDVIKNQGVRFRLSITEGLNGVTTFSETHTATTNSFGLVNLTIGAGTITTGTFAAVNWASGEKFLKIEVDATGGTNYALMGSQQFVSVPYALHAMTANNIMNQWQNNPNGIHYNLGKVGIGTNNPGFKLTMQADESGVYNGSFDPRSFINIRNTSTGQYATANTQLFCGSNTFTKLEHVSPNYFINDFADHGQVWASGKGLILRASPALATDPTATAIKFMTGYRSDGGSNERMRISVDGKVGIGTESPGFKLTLQGDESGVYEGSFDPRSFLNIRNTSTSQYATANTQLFCGSTTFTKLEHVSPNYFINDFADYGQVWASGKGLILRASPASASDPTATAIKFMTGYRFDGGSNERMRVTVDGKVGIGTEAPMTKLEIKDGDVYVNDPTKGIILKSPNGNCWRVTMDNTGNFVRTAITCPN